VVEMILHKVASTPRTDHSVVFASWHWCFLYLIHSFLRTHESAPNGISIGSAVLARLTGVRNADRRTDTYATGLATSVGIGRVYAMQAMRIENETVDGQTNLRGE